MKKEYPITILLTLFIFIFSVLTIKYAGGNIAPFQYAILAAFSIYLTICIIKILA